MTVIRIPSDLIDIFPGEIEPIEIYCYNCSEKTPVDIPYADDLWAGFLALNCVHCGVLCRNDFLTPLDTEYRMAWGLPPLTAVQKLALRNAKRKFPQATNLMGHA